MPQTINSRLESIRHWLTKNNLDALLIPHEDEFLGEYVPEHNERLCWATGFTGSAGAAVIARDKAAIFVDGRYTVQVTKQAPAELFEYRHLVNEPPLQWAKQELARGSKLAIDPRLHSAAWFDKAKESLSPTHELVVIEENPVDLLWENRPQALNSHATLMPTAVAGVSSSDKRLQIAKILKQHDADSALLTALDSICWLLNIRGADISRLPVLLSHAIIHADASVDFFIDSSRLPTDFIEHVGDDVSVYAPQELPTRLSELTGKRVLVDSAITSAYFTLIMQQNGATLVEGSDPCALPKAMKNSAEIAGMRSCHIRDGVAMVKFLSWLDNEVAAERLHDEGFVSDKLESFRAEDEKFRDLSFDTISAAESNAAMCHYNHENEPQPGKLKPNSLYLVDSGGQYLDGTTDLTRTVAIGTPNDEMKQQFTLVLKGHISIARARFPHGTCGFQIDSFARQHLWAHGYDFDHGTGHGVGHFLSVHEGPQSISKRLINVALEEGMVVSNEPGYYRADAFGIRIENLELIVKQETQGDFPVLAFEPLTFCPIDKRVINVNLLTKPELAWLNDYHEQVWNKLNKLLSENDRAWLRQATSPLAYD